MVSIMSEEVTLETLNEKDELILVKLDEIVELITLYDSKISEILSKISLLTSTSDDSDEETDEPTGEFREELESKINDGLPYDQVKEWIISKLEELGLYSEEDMNIKIFIHKTGDMMLEFKVKPYPRWGDAIQFFQSNMGDADYFETSRYDMKNIMWWRLNKNQQMEDQHSTTDIVDDVNEQWGDKDNIDFNNG